MWQRLGRIVLRWFSIDDMAEALLNSFDNRKGRTGSCNEHATFVGWYRRATSQPLVTLPRPLVTTASR